jgi:hypothetical protein
MKLEIINREQLIEGITASIIFPLFIFLFKNIQLNGHRLFFYSGLAWLFTWIIRKISINIFKYYQKHKNIENKTYYIQL